MNKKNIAFYSFIFASILVSPAFSQSKVSSGPYSLTFPTQQWPKTARSLSLGYFNIIGDGKHPEVWANPALAADIADIYLSGGFYPDTDFPENGYFTQDYFYSLSAGFRIVDNVACHIGYTKFVYEYDQIGYSQYEEKAYSFCVGYKLTSDILFGALANYNRLEYTDLAILSSYVSDVVNFNLGVQVRNIFNKSDNHDLLEHYNFYDRWNSKRVPGIDLAFVLRNIGKSHDFYIGPQPNLPLEFGTGISWLAINNNEFGIELLGNYMVDLRNGSYYERGLRRFSFSAGAEATFINLVQLRGGFYNVADTYENFTWGFSLGPPFIRLEYGRIDRLGLLTRDSNLRRDSRDILTLSIYHSLRN